MKEFNPSVKSNIEMNLYALVELLSNARKVIGKTRLQISEEFSTKYGINISPGTFASWENKGFPQIPTEEKLEAISQIYNIDINEVIKARKSALAALAKEKDMRTASKGHKPKKIIYDGSGDGGSKGHKIGSRLY